MDGSTPAGEQQLDDAFEFTGRWQEFLPIVVTNLLLTIVTLGIYRFWAKARERQYLWSRTRFIDDHLEWTGTGKEMFLGFLIVFLCLIPIVLLLMFAARLVTEGNDLGKAVGVALFVLTYGFLFYMTGVAMFRALRYRLTRSYWHGIRGGSDDGGWGYGLKFMWKTVAGFLPFGLLVPWSMTSLWNDRWNKMSYGPHRFSANASASGLLGRWLLIYIAPVIAFLLLWMLIQSMRSQGPYVSEDTAQGYLLLMILIFLATYVLMLLLGLAFFAAYYRHVVDATEIAGLQFRFGARTKDWLLLYLGHIGLIIITLGFGALFIGYRNYSFAVRHLDAYGEVDLNELTQSATRAPGDAEGLADAFDIGAI